ncbi:uncharacterized protein LOC142240337 [Haematobia irritans]|uniref:uncharacterized protein LOC142240337 n=1 Tax=Haematobia irritans TaxID=7368 RepID=UPI003F50308F
MEIAGQSLRTIRKRHISFVYKVYLIACIMVACSIIQWLAINITQKNFSNLLKKYNSIMVGLTFLAFLALLPVQHFLHNERPKRKLIRITYIFIIMEFSSFILGRSLAQSTTSQILKASVLTLVVLVASLCIASRYHMEVEQNAIYLAMWTIRYYLATSVYHMMALTIESQNVEISMTLVLIFFISIFAVVWGRSLGSLVFYRDESCHLSLYITLAYFIFLSLFCNSIEFFKNI